MSEIGGGKWTEMKRGESESSEVVTLQNRVRC